MMPYEKLKAWQACISLYVELHQETALWPKREWYGLSTQIRRAALSAASNIAEGMARKGERELARYLNIALGSLSETACQLYAARAVGLISEETYRRMSATHQNAGRLTWLYYAAIRRRLTEKKQPAG
jgi:four helix bundle protein